MFPREQPPGCREADFTRGGARADVLNRLVRALLFARTTQKAGPFIAKATKADLLVLSELLESGQVVPMIERTYRLREAP